ASNAFPPTVRAQSDELLPRPMPMGPVLNEPPVLDSPEENYNRGVVVEKPNSGPSLVTSSAAIAGPGPCGNGGCGDPEPWNEGVLSCGEEAVCGPSSVSFVDPGRICFRGEYLLWSIRDSHTPALVTTSPPASLGTHGNPGTAVLFGGSI